MPKQKAKIIFIGKANTKPRFGKPRGAPSETNFPLKTHWAALCAAAENFGKIQESQIVARLYDEVRTFFVENDD